MRTVHILCPHMVLLSSHFVHFVLNIPQLNSISRGSMSPVIAGSRLQKFSIGIEVELQGSKKIWNTLCKHHEGRLSVLTESPAEDFDEAHLCFLPPIGQPDDTLLCHHITGGCAIDAE